MISKLKFPSLYNFFLSTLLLSTCYPQINNNRQEPDPRELHDHKIPAYIRFGIIIEKDKNDGSNEPFARPSFKTMDAVRAVEAAFKIFIDTPNILPQTKIKTVTKYVKTDNGFDALKVVCELAKEGIAGYIIVAGCTVSVTLRSYTESLKIPTLLIHTTQCNIQASTIFSLENQLGLTTQVMQKKSTTDIMSYGNYWFGIGSGYTRTTNEALSALIYNEGVKRVVFYTDSLHWPQVNSFASEKGFVLDYFVIQHYPLDSFGQLDKITLYDQFKSMNLNQGVRNNQLTETFIVLFLPLKDSLMLISTIATHKTFSRVKRRYIIPSPEMGNYNLEALVEFAKEEDVVIIRQNIPRTKELKHFVNKFCGNAQKWLGYDDYRCNTDDATEKPLVSFWLYDGIQHLLNSITRVIDLQDWDNIRQGQAQCSINANYKNYNRWPGGINIMNDAKSQTTNGLLGKMAIDENSENDGVTLEILVKTFRSQAFIPHDLTPFTRFNETKFGQLTMDSFRGRGKKNKFLKGTFFNVVTIVEEPFVEEKIVNGKKSYKGFLIDFFNALQDLLGFEYKLYTVVDGKYGVEMANGTWNGMVGDILNDTADIALAAMTITAARDQVVDFTIRYKDYSVGILMKRPKTGVNLWSFFRPFEPPVWICIVLSTFLVGGVLAVLTRISSNLFNRGYDLPPPKTLVEGFDGRSSSG